MADGPSRGTSFWNRVWSDTENRSFWMNAAPEVLAIFQRCPPAEYPRLLDLGCGLGRHAIAAAKAGYHVTASDASQNAIQHLSRWARNVGLDIQTRICPFTEDCFQANDFDIILSVNVLYHGSRSDMARAVANIRRWLTPGGVLYFTCPSWQDEQYAEGRQIAPHTFEFESGHVHYCTCETELRDLLLGFQITKLTECVHHFERQGRGFTSCRWQVSANRT